MQILSTATKPFEYVYTDVVGPKNPVTENGNNYIIIFLDDLIKYVIAIPVPQHDAKTYSKMLVEGIILVYGAPKILVSDNGPELILKRTCKLLKTTENF